MSSPGIYIAMAVSSLFMALCWVAYGWYVADRDLAVPLPGYPFGIGWTAIGVGWFRRAVLLRRAEDENADPT